MEKYNIKQLATVGLVWTVIQTAINCGVFVTFQQMTAYAAPKDAISKIETQLNRIEEKVDKLILARY